MSTRFTRSAALTFVLVVGCAFVPSTATAQNYCLAANPSDSTDDYNALQTCLNSGGTILLSSTGQYIVGSPLQIVHDNTVLSSAGGGRATLKAGPGLAGRILNADVSDYTISSIRLIGRKVYGDDDDDLSGSCGTHGQNANIGGDGYLIDDFESTEAPCGSALVVRGSNYEVRNSYFHNNGWDSGGSWADGLTVGSCDSCWIHGNLMEDNTDIGLVVGGGSGTIEYNTINNFNVHAFAGIHIGWFPGGDGDHSGLTYQYNTVYSDQDMMAFGFVIGFEPWYNGQASLENGFVTHAGTVTDNSIEGAVVNLAVEGILDGYIHDNSYYNNRGSWGYGCSASIDYTAHFFGNASIQSGWTAYWFFRGGCGTWNTGVPTANVDGALWRDTELAVNVPLYSDNGLYRLVLQSDGNLVLYDQYNNSLWDTGTTTGDEAIMQLDGNFVLYAGSSDLFDTVSYGNDGAYLVVQNDGNVVVYSISGAVLWSAF